MPLYHLKPFSSPNIWKKIQTLLHMVCKALKVQALVSCQLCLMSTSPCTDHDAPSRLLSSVQFSRSVVSDSLWPHESHHARPPCPSPFPRVHSNSCPSSRWCHPAISSSVIPFSSCPQSLPASGSFPMSQLFSWGGQSIGVSALASVLPMNIQNWFPFGLIGFISLQSKGLSTVFSNTTVQKHQFFDHCSLLFIYVFVLAINFVCLFIFHTEVKPYSICLPQLDSVHLA